MATNTRAGWFQRWSLPLLAKELIELASRSRTYIMRVVYAVLLYVSAFVMFSGILQEKEANALAVLGRGQSMFGSLMQIQIVGVYLFMPALACSSISQEKERNTLPLLILTKLGPWTILLEKLLSRLVPLWTLLLLGMPLMAFAYSMGGLTQGEFWAACLLLVMFGAQMGAFAVMCSAYCRTAAGALVMTYVLGMFTQIYPPGLGWLLLFFREIHSPAMLLALSFGSLFWTAIFLLIARDFLFRRAFLPQNSVQLGVKRELDGFFQHFGVADRPATSLPKYDPIAWRELEKRPLARRRYWLLALLVIEVPLVGFLLLFSLADSVAYAVAGVFVGMIWIASLLLVAVLGSSLVAAERSAQTLDVLLTTPLPARDLLLQKFSGIRRILEFAWVPFLTVILLQLSWSTSGRFGNRPYTLTEELGHAAVAIASIAIYLPLTAWMAVWVGLQIRNQVRALLTMLTGTIAWLCIPFIFTPLIQAGLLPDPAYLCPSWLIAKNEARMLTPDAAVINLGLHLVWLLVVRHQCLARAERLLRGPEAIPDDTPPPPGFVPRPEPGQVPAIGSQT